MQIDVSQVKRTPGLVQEYQLEDNLDGFLNWQGEKLAFLRPLTLKVIVEGYQGGSIYLKGKVTTEVKAQCSRCLKQVRYPVEAGLEGEFFPGGRSLPEVKEEEFPGQFFAGDFLQLDGLIRENIYLSLPMQFLCSQECQGLCPQCGIRLNLGRCDCEHEQVDPRLEVLKQLFKEKN